MTTHESPESGCPCCSASRLALLGGQWSRRDFLGGMTTAATAALVLSPTVLRAANNLGPAALRPPGRKPLRMQPVLVYETPVRREQTSWRSWGGIQTEADAAKEQTVIAEELAKMKEKAGFPLEVLPVCRCKTPDQAAEIRAGDHDGVI
ncbi:MAG: twin-arginine translocation signal domain-containing protein, partial [Verrucomicrobiae bacterium]|nr:twin-arginine translocation signal domain-containing protein [Verrucomicrobiae bacterium]